MVIYNTLLRIRCEPSGEHALLIGRVLYFPKHTQNNYARIFKRPAKVIDIHCHSNNIPLRYRPISKYTYYFGVGFI